MRRSIACFILGALALVAARHAMAWPVATAFARSPESPVWGALSFALAAVIDPES